MTTSGEYPVPAWRVVLDGKDLTQRLSPRLLSLTLTECRGGEADQLELRIHDHDGAVALPKKGVQLHAAIGWQGQGLVDKGMFTVDEVEYSGSPDVICIRARSADLTAAMRTRRDRSWHRTTLGEVLNTIAGEHSLQPRVSASLASTAVDHLDQTEESDANLLTRLSKRYDAVATVKTGTLIFAPIGAGETATGKPIPSAAITKRLGDQYRWSAADRDVYSGVRAYWHDKGKAKRTSVLVGTSGNAKRLRETFASETAARENAEAEWNRLRRGACKFSITLALGRADLYPEQRLDVAGVKDGIDGEWLIARVAHTIDASSGFATALELETPTADGQAESGGSGSTE